MKPKKDWKIVFMGSTLSRDPHKEEIYRLLDANDDEGAIEYFKRNPKLINVHFNVGQGYHSAFSHLISPTH